MADRALLIGIDEYPDPVNRLNSCVNDTEAFKNLLAGLGFEDTAFKVLHNADATLAAARDGLDWLFEGARSGDRLVFFQSSHGYRYLKGDVMTEVLCEYDDFLEDTELVSRSSGLPPGVLTVVLDACHSGGMEKSIFVRGEARSVRAKVLIPPGDLQLRAANALTAARGVKPFGRTALTDEASLARNMANVPDKAPPAKGPITGGLELNGVLFAACQADQTAAAGSDATHFLSAFTYAVTTEMNSAESVIALRDATVRCIADLNMSQTPCVFVPKDHQDYLSETFISMSQEVDKEWVAKMEKLLKNAADSGLTSSSYAGGGGASDSGTQSKETKMATTSAHETVAEVLERILRESSGSKDYVGELWTPELPNWLSDLGLCTAAVAPAVAAAIPAAGQGKDLAVQQPLSDPSRITDKSMMTVAVALARAVVPAVLDALSKEGGAPGAGKGFQMDAKAVEQRIAASIPANRLGNKDFLNWVTSTISDLAPIVLDAISKDYSTGGRPPAGTLGTSLPPGLSAEEAKGWFSDLTHAVSDALPYVIDVVSAVA